MFFILRSLLYGYRIFTESNDPQFSSQNVDKSICYIDEAEADLKKEHLYWYYRLGINCE